MVQEVAFPELHRKWQAQHLTQSPPFQNKTKNQNLAPLGVVCFLLLTPPGPSLIKTESKICFLQLWL